MGNHPLWHLAIDEHLGGWGCTVLHFQPLATPCKASFKASWEFGLTKTGSLATTFLGCMGWFDGACWNSSWWHSENCSLTMTRLPLFHPWQSQDEFLSLCVSTGGQGQQDRFPEYHFPSVPYQLIWDSLHNQNWYTSFWFSPLLCGKLDKLVSLLWPSFCQL